MPPPTRIIKRGMFGPPTLQWLKNNGTESNGLATWVKEWTRYGEWTAKLAPGTQTDDDYGAVEFAVNDMPLIDLKSIRYIYRMGATEVVAPNVAIHVYDPSDIDNRADITLSHSHDDLGKTQLTWYKFDVLPATTGLFYYGDNIPTTTGLTGDNGTSLYTLAQYQADAVFKNYVIGKITIEYGYYSTGHLTAAHIAKISVNEEDILLEPPAGYRAGTDVKAYAKETVTLSTTRVALVTPATGRKIRVISVKCTSVHTTPNSFEVYFGTGNYWASDASKAIFFTHLATASGADKLSFPSDSIVWPEGEGPIGVADEVVSMRTGADIASYGTFLITYREE